MNVPQPIRRFAVDSLEVLVYEDRASLGAAAAEDCARELRDRLSTKAGCRMVFAAAPSQNELLAGLVRASGVDWTRVRAFHMDEYLGLPEDAPQRFGVFLRKAIFGLLPFGGVEYLGASGDAPLGAASAAAEEAGRYAALIAEAPIDLVCMGIGENGHIAFNDPAVADFDDPSLVKEVTLDEACRFQQVHDGCFPDLDSVPRSALTLTVPALMSGARLFCVVPGPTKARAVREALYGPITERCPASVLRRHRACSLYLDRESARELP